MEEFSNGYGGFMSIDDDVCLFTSADGNPPTGIDLYDED